MNKGHIDKPTANVILNGQKLTLPTTLRIIFIFYPSDFNFNSLKISHPVLCSYYT